MSRLRDLEAMILTAPRRPSPPEGFELESERQRRFIGGDLFEQGTIGLEDLDPGLPDYFAAGLFNAFFRDSDG